MKKTNTKPSLLLIIKYFLIFNDSNYDFLETKKEEEEEK